MKLDATSLSTAPGEKAHVKLAFVSEDRIASFSGEADVDPTTPAATGRFELAKFSLGLLFPYYSEVLDVDVQKGSLDLAARFSVDTGGNLTLSDGVGTISELSLALPGNRSPLWRVPTLTATGVDVDVRARKVTFGELKSHSPSLRIVRERDGSLEFARVLKTGQAKHEPTGGEWTIAMTRTSTERGAIDFEDRVPTPAVKLAIRDVDLLASDLSNARGAKSQVKLSGRIGERGRMAFAGPVATRPLSLSGTLEASGLALVALKPYFEHEVNVVITGGVLAVKGQVGLDVPDGAAVRGSWKGEMKVTDFASFDKPTSSDLAHWKSLVVEGMDIASEPFRAATGRIALEDFYARVIVYPDATINIARLVTPGASPEPAPDAKPAPPAERGAPSEALPVSIGRIELARGNVVFSDMFIRPNYSANLTDVAGSVSAMSANQAGDVALTASVDGIAPVEVQGRIHPFASELSLDLAGKARDIELPPLTPYSVKYAGYGIEKGKLTFDVHYRVENRKLTAENRLVLDQLTFGERVESPTATKLPVLRAVALLKDRHGVIDIQLPISGSLDDPQFSVGGLIEPRDRQHDHQGGDGTVRALGVRVRKRRGAVDALVRAGERVDRGRREEAHRHARQGTRRPPRAQARHRRTRRSRDRSRGASACQRGNRRSSREDEIARGGRQRAGVGRPGHGRRGGAQPLAHRGVPFGRAARSSPQRARHAEGRPARRDGGDAARGREDRRRRAASAREPARAGGQGRDRRDRRSGRASVPDRAPSGQRGRRRESRGRRDAGCARARRPRAALKAHWVTTELPRDIEHALARAARLVPFRCNKSRG